MDLVCFSPHVNHYQPVIGFAKKELINVLCNLGLHKTIGITQKHWVRGLRWAVRNLEL